MPPYSSMSSYSRVPTPKSAAASMVWMPLRLLTRSMKCSLPGSLERSTKSMLASLDPVAIDQACIDLVLRSNDPGKEHFMERVNSRNGIHTIEAAADLGVGTREYELIEL